MVRRRSFRLDLIMLLVEYVYVRAPALIGPPQWRTQDLYLAGPRIKCVFKLIIENIYYKYILLLAMFEEGTILCMCKATVK